MTSEHEAITQVALDYYEAWFDGDGPRMERVLHPNLVKRRAGHEDVVTTKERMVELTRRGEGKEDAADRRLDVEVEDVNADIASVTVRAARYYEYLHLVRTPEGWQIASALYQLR